MKMPFGRHEGELLRDLPDGYLLWLSGRDLYEPLRSAVRDEVRRRGGSSRQHDEPRQDRPHGNPPAHLFVATIGRVRREAALKYHPDRGGSVAEMSAVNATLDRLEELAKA